MEAITIKKNERKVIMKHENYETAKQLLNRLSHLKEQLKMWSSSSDFESFSTDIVIRSIKKDEHWNIDVSLIDFKALRDMVIRTIKEEMQNIECKLQEIN